jgi:hypothetical protein
MLEFLLAESPQESEEFDQPDAKLCMPTQDSTYFDEQERTSANTTAASESIFDNYPEETTGLTPKRKQSDNFT